MGLDLESFREGEELIWVQSTARVQHNHSLEWSGCRKFCGPTLSESLETRNLSIKLNSLLFNGDDFLPMHDTEQNSWKVIGGQQSLPACLNSWKFPIQLFTLPPSSS
jgi:hypothetical protein